MNDTTVNPREWTAIITPSRRLLDLRLREIWSYRDLILRFFHRDFVAGYKQTVLGPLWFILPQLFTTVVFTLMFGSIARVSTDGAPGFLFYNLGLVAWSFFASCLTRTATTFAGNSGIFGKVYFPRLVVPASMILSNLATFAVQFAFFGLLYGIYWLKGTTAEPNWRILVVPLLLVQMAALGLGVGCIVSALTTRFRDLALMVAFGTQLWMYGSCVIFPLSQVPPQWKMLFILNPMVPIIEAFRFAILGGGSVEIWQLGISAAITVIVLATGLIMFNRAEKTFMDTI